MDETQIQQISHSLSLRLIPKFIIVSLDFKTLRECSRFIRRP